MFQLREREVGKGERERWGRERERRRRGRERGGEREENGASEVTKGEHAQRRNKAIFHVNSSLVISTDQCLPKM